MTEMHERSHHVVAIFRQALSLTGDERLVYLDRACGGDELVRQAVDELLSTEVHPDFLEVAAPELAAAEIALSERLDADKTREGTLFGNYRLLREIGSGGMSLVWLAERADGQFEQRVAIKILRRIVGDPEDSRRRFETERKVLAQLKHPHVAQIFDGGIHDGRPYVVLEYLEGKSITEHCEKQQLDLEGRLGLFLDVCAAVTHAHRHLVVHRDLKPSNILVTTEDGVKLLDFGIAKLLAQQGTNDLLTAPKTRTGLLLLTPEYAAPEQLRSEPITTATDVYGLGLVLFELLTGARPFKIEGKRASEIEQIICEQPPSKPSRFKRENAGASGAARKIDHTALQGDLDTIVLKALRKQPGDRYGSVQELSDDLRRHMDARPVLARPATTGYRLRKFVQRNLWPLVTAVGFAALLVAGLISVRLEQRDTARQRDRAEAEAKKARRVTDFTLDLLERANPVHGPDVTVRQTLLDSIDRIDELNDEPTVQAEVVSVVSEALSRLGAYQEAEVLVDRMILLRQALEGPLSENLATTLGRKANLRTLQGDHEASEQLLLEALDINDRTFPGEDREPKVWHLRQLVRHYLRTGQDDRIGEPLDRGLAMARRLGLEAQVDSFLGSRAFAWERAGNFEAAIPVRTKLIKRLREREGELHPDVATHLTNLAYAASQLNDFHTAIEHLEQALTIREEVLPAGHFRIGTVLMRLGDAHTRVGRYTEGEAHLIRAIEIIRSSLGDTASQLIPSRIALGRSRLLQDDLSEAEINFERALQVAKHNGTASRPLGIWHAFGDLYLREGRLEEAQEAYQAELTAVETQWPEHRKIVVLLLSLSDVTAEAGETEKTRALLRRAAELAGRILKAGDATRGEVESRLATKNVAH